MGTKYFKDEPELDLSGARENFMNIIDEEKRNIIRDKRKISKSVKDKFSIISFMNDVILAAEEERKSKGN